MPRQGNDASEAGLAPEAGLTAISPASEWLLLGAAAAPPTDDTPPTDALALPAAGSGHRGPAPATAVDESVPFYYCGRRQKHKAFDTGPGPTAPSKRQRTDADELPAGEVVIEVPSFPGASFTAPLRFRTPCFREDQFEHLKIVISCYLEDHGHKWQDMSTFCLWSASKGPVSNKDFIDGEIPTLITVDWKQRADDITL